MLAGVDGDAVPIEDCLIARRTSVETVQVDGDVARGERARRPGGGQLGERGWQDGERVGPPTACDPVTSTWSDPSAAGCTA